MIGISTLLNYMPSRAVSLGMTKMQGALLLLTMGICSITTRFVNSFIANLKCVNRILELGGAITTGGVILCLLTACTNFPSIAVASGAFGIVYGKEITSLFIWCLHNNIAVVSSDWHRQFQVTPSYTFLPGTISSVSTTALADLVGQNLIAKAQGFLSMCRGFAGFIALPLAGR